MTPRAIAPRELTELERTGRIQTGPDTWMLWWGWEKNPLPMNGGHGHWRPAKKAERNVRDAALLRIRAAQIPAAPRVRAQVAWWVADHRTRDVDNLARLEKRIFDAIVLAGIVEDDRPELMTKPRAVIRHIGDTTDAPVTRPCITLTLTRLPEAGDA